MREAIEVGGVFQPVWLLNATSAFKIVPALAHGKSPTCPALKPSQLHQNFV